MAGHNDRGFVRLASLWWLIVVDGKVTAFGSWTPGRDKQTKALERDLAEECKIEGSFTAEAPRL